MDSNSWLEALWQADILTFCLTFRRSAPLHRSEADLLAWPLHWSNSDLLADILTILTPVRLYESVVAEEKSQVRSCGLMNGQATHLAMPLRRYPRSRVNFVRQSTRLEAGGGGCDALSWWQNMAGRGAPSSTQIATISIDMAAGGSRPMISPVTGQYCTRKLSSGRAAGWLRWRSRCGARISAARTARWSIAGPLALLRNCTPDPALCDDLSAYNQSISVSVRGCGALYGARADL